MGPTVIILHDLFEYIPLPVGQFGLPGFLLLEAAILFLLLANTIVVTMAIAVRLAEALSNNRRWRQLWCPHTRLAAWRDMESGEMVRRCISCGYRQ